MYVLSIIQSISMQKHLGNLNKINLCKLKQLTLHWGPSKGRFKTDATTSAVCVVLENGE